MRNFKRLSGSNLTNNPNIWTAVVSFGLTGMLLFIGDFSNAHTRKKRSSKTKRSGIYALYQNPIAGKGMCLPSVSNPSAILSRNGIATKGANDAERAALAKGIAQIERLLDGPLPKSWRQNFYFVNSSGTWKQSVKGVIVRRPKGSSKGLLTGRMIHELAHRVGNRGGQYTKYNRYVRGSPCRLTPYCSDSKNEEFAEAFEAFIVTPELLRTKCAQAYKFFKTELFPKSGRSLASCTNLNGKIVPGKLPGPETAR